MKYWTFLYTLNIKAISPYLFLLSLRHVSCKTDPVLVLLAPDVTTRLMTEGFSPLASLPLSSHHPGWRGGDEVTWVIQLLALLMYNVRALHDTSVAVWTLNTFCGADWNCVSVKVTFCKRQVSVKRQKWNVIHVQTSINVLVEIHYLTSIKMGW